MPLHPQAEMLMTLMAPIAEGFKGGDRTPEEARAAMDLARFVADL